MYFFFCVCVCVYLDLVHVVAFLEKKTLQELKQLFFEMADNVFGTKNRYGYGCDSEGFSAILKGYFGEDMKMGDITEPK